jgi:cytochrome c peroxidase
VLMISLPTVRICRGLIAVACLLSATGAWGSPLGLPAETVEDLGSRPALIKLGQQLFSDSRLSVDGTTSCASCHLRKLRFTDGRPTAKGLHGEILTRRTPSLLNVRYATSLFWDGRAANLEEQVRSPLLAPAEHGFSNERAVGEVVRRDATYVAAFKSLFRVSIEEISIQQVSVAIATYERTLLSGDSPFDRYWYGGDRRAISLAAIRGLELFRGRAQCVGCHTIGTRSALFTDGEFHPSPLQLPASTLKSLGTLSARVALLRHRNDEDAINALIETSRDVAALGRFVVTLEPKDIGRFKTPSLRDIAVKAPYMHNGSVETLPAAVDLELYSRSDRTYPLVLTEDERSDLLEFLLALTSN